VLRPQVLLGSALVAVGGVFLLDALEVLDAWPTIGRWWPLALVALGAARMLSRPADLLGGAVTGGIGLLVLGFTTGAVDGSIFRLALPLLLIGVGAYLVLTRRGAAPASGTTSDDTVSSIVVFGGQQLRPTSSSFQGGSLVAVFGGVEIDLRHADLAPGAHLDVTAIFGGVEISVPPGWRVRATGPGIFGGTDNGADRQQLPPDAPTLDVRSLAIFGGVDVRLVAPATHPPA
jgi:hypothetical protein